MRSVVVRRGPPAGDVMMMWAERSSVLFMQGASATQKKIADARVSFAQTINRYSSSLHYFNVDTWNWFLHIPPPLRAPD